MNKMFAVLAYWLKPGIGIKRWCVLFGLGVAILSVTIAFVIVEYYQFVSNVSDEYAKVLPVWILVILLVVVSMTMVLYSVAKISREIVGSISSSGRTVASEVAERRRKRRGPRIVVIGGGTGMSTLLQGLKKYTSNITAIITVADDGGSSGRLRRELGVLPPGDLRNCIIALADDEALLTQLFKYRFGEGDEISGHSFGNLFITAMTEVTGSFERALAVSGQVLAIGGEVLPSTLEDVILTADVREYVGANAYRVVGESAIPEKIGSIERIELNPPDAPANPRALQAILKAELIVLGPGSLFTSVVPNLLIRDISAAIQNSRGLKIYVSNLATQRGETDGFSLSMHAQIIDKYANETFAMVLCNNCHSGDLLPDMEWVMIDTDLTNEWDVHSYDLIDETCPWRHDSNKLASVLLKLLREHTNIAVL
jgi:uncharacterized cofD-like protein